MAGCVANSPTGATLSEISVTDAAKRLGVGRVALSRLSKALGTSPEFWYGLQVNYDLSSNAKMLRPDGQ